MDGRLNGSSASSRIGLHHTRRARLHYQFRENRRDRPNGKTRVKELVLIGGGEHARVVLDAARRGGQWTVTAYVDKVPIKSLEALGLSWLGDDTAAAQSLRDRYCIVGVGGMSEPRRRQEIVRLFDACGVKWATVVHPSAVIAATAELGVGVAVFANAVVNPGAKIGAHSIINTGAIVEHDVELGPYVHAGPGAVIGGGAAIGEGVAIGLGARVRDHVRIGPGAMIGMGAVVVGSVRAHDTVVGVPARQLQSRPEPGSRTPRGPAE